MGYRHAPQIHINDHAGNGTDGDPNEDLLKITWDLEKQGYENEDGSYNYQKGAVYDYLLTGYTADGTAVQAGSGTYVTGTDGDNELSYDCLLYTSRFWITRRNTGHSWHPVVPRTQKLCWKAL